MAQTFDTKTGEYRITVLAFNKRKVMARAARTLERQGKKVTNDLSSMLELEPEMALLMTTDIQKKAADGSYASVPKTEWRALYEEYDGLTKQVMAWGESLAAERDAEFEVASGN